VEGLQQKAGVAQDRLRRLVLKEIADNALDTGTRVQVGKIEGGYFIEDQGSGLDPDQVASLFSVNRPLVSTKLLRLPTRGALGNGLRVVAGAVLASDGFLIVETRGAPLRLKPGRDGYTQVVERSASARRIGTRIEAPICRPTPMRSHARRPSGAGQCLSPANRRHGGTTCRNSMNSYIKNHNGLSDDGSPNLDAAGNDISDTGCRPTASSLTR
jgi:hypothetical protein